MNSQNRPLKRTLIWDLLDGATYMLSACTILMPTRRHEIQMPDVQIKVNTPDELLQEAWDNTEQALRETNALIVASLRAEI